MIEVDSACQAEVLDDLLKSWPYALRRPTRVRSALGRDSES